MAIDVYFCDRCGLAFQVETPDENQDGRAATDAESDRTAPTTPACPKCEHPGTTRMYRMPAQPGGCLPAGGC